MTIDDIERDWSRELRANVEIYRRREHDYAVLINNDHAYNGPSLQHVEGFLHRLFVTEGLVPREVDGF